MCVHCMVKNHRAQISIMTPSKFVLIIFIVHMMGNTVMVTSQNIKIKVIENNKTDNVSCIAKFYEKMMQSTHSILFTSFVEDDHSTIRKELLQIIAHHQNNYFNVTITNLNPSLSQARATPLSQSSVYFLILATIDELTVVIEYWGKISSWNPFAYILVILNFGIDYSISRSQMKYIFEVFLANGMVNVFIFCKNDTSTEIAGWIPHENEKDCIKSVENIYLLNQCQPAEYKGTIHSNNYIAETTSNFHGCSINVSAAVWEPFVTKATNKSSKKLWSGVEVNVLQIIANRLNLSLNFILNSERRTNRELNRNSGLYVHLVRKDAQILIGGLDHDPNTMEIFSETIPYYYDDQAWCIARAKQTASWKNIFEIFSLGIWMTIVGTFFMITAFVCSGSRNRSTGWALLNAFAICLSMPTYVDRPFHFRSRCIFYFILLYAMFINIMFSSFLVTTLTKQRFQKQVTTINETIENDFSFCGGQVVKTHLSLRNDKISSHIRSRYEVCDDINSCIIRLKNETKLAVAVSRLHISAYKIAESIDFFCFSKINSVYSFPVSLLTDRNFYLLPKVNDIINRLLENGLIRKWLREEFYGSLSQSYRERKYYEKNFGIPDSTTTIVITIRHISGAIVFLYIGYMFATVVFFIEILMFQHGYKNLIKT